MNRKIIDRTKVTKKALAFRLSQFMFMWLMLILFSLMAYSKNLHANSLDLLTAKPMPIEQEKQEENNHNKVINPKGEGSVTPEAITSKSDKNKSDNATNWFDDAWFYLQSVYYQWQLKFSQATAKLLLQIKQGEAAENSPIWSLIFISFIYGILHAAGPGHGKAVLATYLGSNLEVGKTKFKSAILLAFFMAQVQALTAIALVWLLFVIFEQVSASLQTSLQGMYWVSAFVLFALASWLLFVASKNIYLAFRKTGENLTCTHTHEHEACNCNHGVGILENTDAKSSFWQQSLIILTVALRPCSGAIMILALSKALNIWLTGVIAVIFMGLGVGITMISLALVALLFSNFASRLVKAKSSNLSLIANFFKLLAGLLILLFAVLLFNDETVMGIGNLV